MALLFQATILEHTSTGSSEMTKDTSEMPQRGVVMSTDARLPTSCRKKRSLRQMLAECDLESPLELDEEDRQFLESPPIGRELI